MNQENIGKFISELRNEKNMTQQQLADKLSVTDRAISNWENGRRLPDISLMKELCSIFGITIDELIYCKKIKKEDIDNILEKNAIELYTTKRKIENLQILTELLICAGIVITITLTAMISKTTTERIITLCIGSFVWTFGIILRIILRKIYNPYK